MGSTNGDRGGEIPQPRDFVNDEQDGDENFSALREAENLCLLGSIYNRLDEQFKLLQEQKLAQQLEAERAENHRMKVEQIFDDLGARIKQTEISVETIRGETAAIAKQVRTLEQRAVLWDSTQERMESVHSELVSDMYMRLQEKFQNKFKTIEQQLAEQKCELHKLKLLHGDALNVTKVQLTPQNSVTKVGNATSKSTRKLPSIPTSSQRQPSYVTATDGNDINENSRPVQRPVAYSGESIWESYIAQFEITAQLNGWNYAQMAAYLATSLKGPALNVLGNLPPERRQDYHALVAALESRFGSTHRTELSRVKFKHRVRQKDESLAALAEELERLGRLSYPDASQELQDVLSRDQFVDALPDEDMRLRIKQERPESLQKALELALELESFQIASKQRSYRTSRGTSFDTEKTHGNRTEKKGNDSTVPKELAPVYEMVDRLEKSIHQCLSDIVTAISKQRKPAPRSGKSGCWRCGKSGHIRRNCPSESPPKRDERKIDDQNNTNGPSTSQGSKEENDNRERIPGNVSTLGSRG